MRLGDFVALSLFLVTVAWILLLGSALTLPSDTTWTLFGAKLTFFSIIFAVGWFQYGYFYEAFKRFFQEFAPTWEGWDAFRTSTDEREEVVRRAQQKGVRQDLIDPVQRQVESDRERLGAAEENRKKVLSGVGKDLTHFQTTLGLLFGVGVALIVSLLADVIGRLVALHRTWNALSHAAFLVGLFQFVILGILFVMIVSKQLSILREGAQKYRGIRFQ